MKDMAGGCVSVVATSTFVIVSYHAGSVSSTPVSEEVQNV